MHALFPLANAEPLVMALAIGLGLGAVGLSRNALGGRGGRPLGLVSLPLFCRRPLAEPGTEPSIMETKQ